MASSNVQYYEKQKELQDTMTDCEQQRLQLDKQLRLALQSDQANSKLRAAKLQTYWKKICDDEKRAKQRNEMLMREFERIDAHMAEMNARTQRLALMKKQYEDYISRTYPAWDKLMHGSPQQEAQPGFPHEQQEGHQQQQQQQQQQQHQQHQQQHIQEQPRTPPHQTQTPRDRESDEAEEEPEEEASNLTNLASRLSELEEQRQRAEKPFSDQVDNRQSESRSGLGGPPGNYQQKQQHHSQQQQPLQANRRGGQGHADSGQVLGESSLTGEYVNLPSARSQGKPEHRETSADQTQSAISQPVRSIEIQSKASGKLLQSDSYVMEPEDDDEDEETSEFVTDNELPMAQSLGNTVKANPSSPQKSKYTGPVKPELSIDGLLRLLNLVETDMAEAFSLEGYYRASWPDTARKNDIVRKSNNNEDLSQVDANLISMVILEQITLIVRSLTEKCLLPESLLQQNLATLTAMKLRQHLSPEAQVVWDALFSHFQKLVASHAMEPQELSAIFTPSLVASTNSQDRGHMFMVQLLERQMEAGNNRLSALTPRGGLVSPRHTLEGSGSFAEDGRVPPLKFGSLLDKPVSDDESSYVKSSLPRDPVPLNETAAYKSMVSGTSVVARRTSSAQEDTDDDVEKQMASALTQKIVDPSPRQMDDPSETSSMQTTSPKYVPTAAETRQALGQSSITKGPPKFQGVKISSDLDTDTEVDVGIFGSSKKTMEDDFDFYD